jgi:cytochrome c-type protein NapB
MIRKLSVSLLAAAFGAALSTAAFAVDTPINGAPKPVPHSVTEYLPITQDKNACILCHKRAGAQPKKGEIPATHYEKDGKLSALRWECSLCHAPNVDQSTYSFQLQ